MVDRGDILLAEPPGDVVGEFAGDDAVWLDAVGLEALGSDAVVADQRVREGQHLFLVAWVREALLVARVRGRKDQFPACRARGTRACLYDALALDSDVGVRHYETRTKLRLISVAFEDELRNS